MNLTIGTKLIAGTAAMLALALVLGITGLTVMGAFKEQFDNAADKTIHKVELSAAIVTANSEMISAQRGLILATFAKDAAEAEKYKTAFSENAQVIRQSLSEMIPMLVTQEGKDLTADIAAKLSEWQPHYEDAVKQCAAGNLAEANRIRKDITGPIYNQIGKSARAWRSIRRSCSPGTKPRLMTSSQKTAGFRSVCSYFPL